MLKLPKRESKTNQKAKNGTKNVLEEQSHPDVYDATFL